MSSESNSDPPTFEHTYNDKTPASRATIQAICAVENINPADAPDDLGFTLYNHLDPEAVDKIVKDGTVVDVHVEFLFASYRIQILIYLGWCQNHLGSPDGTKLPLKHSEEIPNQATIS